MKALNWKWIGISVAIAAVATYADVPPDGIIAAQKSFDKTRLELQAQGFKTDLTNFDFSTSPDLRAREAILKAAAPNRRESPPVDHPELMEETGNNQVVVVWKQDSLRRQIPSWPATGHELTWDDFEGAIDQSRAQVDAACIAILSGPIQFDLNASAGSFMLLPHLATLKNLTQMLNGRDMLALHEGNREVAWTNLMAATRLVTAWNPEPTEISHRVRFADARLVFEATWQLLQTNGWTDDQLARLQHEWESAELLSHLPEVQAFRRASDLKTLESDTASPQEPMDRMFEDEEQLLIFYRDREIEYRNAVQAGTWMQMRSLPGVTNEILFEPKYHKGGRFRMSLNQRRMAMRIAGHGVSTLGQAAEAEAKRRIIIVALALERYCGRHQHYPKTLQDLTPEFLTSMPLDFMNGKPLHYETNESRRFLLYSVGLDCADNDGKIEPLAIRKQLHPSLKNLNATTFGYDIVWPLAASSAEVVALRDQQSQAEAERKTQREEDEKIEKERRVLQVEQSRQEAMKRLLAEKPSLGKEPVYQGKPLSSWVIKVGQIERYNGAPEDAVEAIRAIGSQAVPFLLEWMPHPGAVHSEEGFPTWDGVEFAWWALGAKGKAAIPELTRLISRPERNMDDYSIWIESVKAISYLGSDAVIPMLTVATNMQGKHELWELLHNFENLGTNGAFAVPALVHWANDPDYWVRAGVVGALGGIGRRPDLAVPVLTNALQHDDNSMVRRDAAEALGSFANDSDVVLPELTKALQDPDWQAREGALTGLGKIQNKPQIVVPLIAPFLYDNNNVIQRSAAYALRDLGNEAGYRAVLQASNAPTSWPGIGDIIYEVQKKSHPDKPQ